MWSMVSSLEFAEVEMELGQVSATIWEWDYTFCLFVFWIFFFFFFLQWSTIKIIYNNNKNADNIKLA